jgi:hypothetical protein
MAVVPDYRTLFRSVSLILLVCLSGCGQATSTVSGKVRYLNAPLATGSVLLLASDGTSHHGAIQPDGSFRIPKVPTGLARVSVTSQDASFPSGQDLVQARMQPIHENAVRSAGSLIPLRYGDLQQSGLQVEVKPGSTSLDLALTGN